MKNKEQRIPVRTLKDIDDYNENIHLGFNEKSIPIEYFDVNKYSFDNFIVTELFCSDIYGGSVKFFVNDYKSVQPLGMDINQYILKEDLDDIEHWFSLSTPRIPIKHV